jgi:hypothetical protein
LSLVLHLNILTSATRIHWTRIVQQFKWFGSQYKEQIFKIRNWTAFLCTFCLPIITGLLKNQNEECKLSVCHRTSDIKSTIFGQMVENRDLRTSKNLKEELSTHSRDISQKNLSPKFSHIVRHNEHISKLSIPWYSILEQRTFRFRDLESHEIPSVSHNSSFIPASSTCGICIPPDGQTEDRQLRYIWRYPWKDLFFVQFFRSSKSQSPMTQLSGSLFRFPKWQKVVFRNLWIPFVFFISYSAKRFRSSSSVDLQIVEEFGWLAFVNHIDYYPRLKYRVFRNYLS